MSGPRRRRWGRWVVVLILIGAGGGAALRYYKRPPAAPLSFRTATVSLGDLTQLVTANGNLNPLTNVQVGSQISGILKEIKVDYNSHVKEGEVLAQIDPSTYEQNVTSSEADLASVQAALELAELEYRRQTDLRKSQLISQSDQDTAAANFHQAQAAVKMREAAVHRDKVDLERTTIYAPISGVVISRNVDVGQTVAASFSTPTLFVIANDLTKMQIEAMVSEADVGGVAEGEAVDFTVDAYQGQQFHGVVSQVRYAAVTNQNVVNYTTVVRVENPDLKLRPGMTAYASIITARRTNILRIPNGAFLFRPPKEALVRGATNAPGPNLQATNLDRGPGVMASLAPAGRSGPAADPPGPGGDAASREERRRRWQSMTPEQREQMRATMRARNGGGLPGAGGPGFGGQRSAPHPAAESTATHTVYLLEKEIHDGVEQPVLHAVTIKTGITDGSVSEVLEGLKEGDVVVTGLNVSGASIGGPQARSPFGGPFGFRPR